MTWKYLIFAKVSLLLGFAGLLLLLSYRAKGGVFGRTAGLNGSLLIPLRLPDVTGVAGLDLVVAVLAAVFVADEDGDGDGDEGSPAIRVAVVGDIVEDTGESGEVKGIVLLFGEGVVVVCGSSEVG